MKSLITFLFLLSFGMLSAQNLTLTPSEATLTGNGDYVDYYQIDLTNNSSSVIGLGVRLERLCYNDDDETEIQICTPVTCYFNVSDDITWGAGNAEFFLGAGQTTDSIKFTPFDQLYGSEWNLVFFNVEDEEDKATLHVVIGDCNSLITSTNDFKYSIGKAYPNPATDVINIAYEINVNEANLNVYNAMGMLVETLAVSPETNRVSVDVVDYVNGVYFYNITDGKEQSKMMSFVK